MKIKLNKNQIKMFSRQIIVGFQEIFTELQDVHFKTLCNICNRAYLLTASNRGLRNAFVGARTTHFTPWGDFVVVILSIKTTIDV